MCRISNTGRITDSFSDINDSLNGILEEKAYRDSIQELLEDGKTNKRLKHYFAGLESFEDGFDIPDPEDSCNLCWINRYPKSSTEIIRYETDNFYIVEPLHKKSHKSRNMLVTKGHVGDSDEELSEYAYEGLNKLLEITKSDIGSEPMVIYSGMNTSPHFHLQCSDLKPENRDAAKLDEVNNFIIYDDSIEGFKPSEYALRRTDADIVGEAYLDRMVDSAIETGK